MAGRTIHMIWGRVCSDTECAFAKVLVLAQNSALPFARGADTLRSAGGVTCRTGSPSISCAQEGGQVEGLRFGNIDAFINGES